MDARVKPAHDESLILRFGISYRLNEQERHARLSST
jgi:hypothetical protein